MTIKTYRAVILQKFELQSEASLQLLFRKYFSS